MKTAKELNITPAQRRNIAKLTLFVKDAVSPPKFDIRTYHSLPRDPSEVHYECGTTACFCGYGPLAGIKAKKDEHWGEYSTRTLVDEYSEAWDFLFDNAHKNSKTAAVRRGAWFLMKGLPSNVVLATWETPASFRHDWEGIKKIARLQNP